MIGDFFFFLLKREKSVKNHLSQTVCDYSDCPTPQPLLDTMAQDKLRLWVGLPHWHPADATGKM